jgi:ubiquinone/menaquinone biosynthesis C-methylase UbiE
MIRPGKKLITRQPEPELMDLPSEAQAYAAADFSDVNQAFVNRLIELTGPLPTATAIDLGTGPGEIPLRLWKARPGWNITALDASQAMLDIAMPLIRKAGAEQKIKLLLADAKQTGLPAQHFDVIFSNSILHHVSDAIAFWRELARIGRQESILFLRDLARPADVAEAKAILKKHTLGESDLLKEEFYRSLLAAYTVEEVKQQLAAIGLGNLSVAKSSDRHFDVWGRLP